MHVRAAFENDYVLTFMSNSNIFVKEITDRCHCPP